MLPTLTEEPRTETTLERQLRLIGELNLEPIAVKLIKPGSGEQGMTKDEALTAIELYRCFLKLLAMYPELGAVPFDIIDEVWHNHILDTEKYYEDCMRIFGRFIHHFPYRGLLGEEDRREWQADFKRTIALFQEHFGEVSASALPDPCGGSTHCKAPPPGANSDQLRPTLAMIGA